MPTNNGESRTLAAGIAGCDTEDVAAFVLCVVRRDKGDHVQIVSDECTPHVLSVLSHSAVTVMQMPMLPHTWGHSEESTATWEVPDDASDI
jgi:hypothetical protein